MLTNTQQQRIQFITEQFEKLNGSTQPKTKFNLVDIKPLEDKKEKIIQLDKEDEVTYKMWKELQENELHRIVALFDEDLPRDRTLIKTSSYTISICRMQFLSNGSCYASDHHEECVKISVELKRKSYWDEYSQKHRDEYSNLYYRLNYNRDVEYSTIEELCATDEFKDTLRKRVL